MEGRLGCKQRPPYNVTISRLKSVKVYSLEGSDQVGQCRAELSLRSYISFARV